MGVTFILPHLTTGHRTWLTYSHGTVARGEVPTDRQVVKNWADPTLPGIRFAKSYFLTDMAHKMLPGGYKLTPLQGLEWSIEIHDRKQAAMFKLTFM